MRKLFLWIGILTVSTNAFAAAAGGDRRVEPADNAETVPPLLYAVPETASDSIEFRVVRGKVLLVKELVALPAEHADGAAIAVLRTHCSRPARNRQAHFSQAAGCFVAQAMALPARPSFRGLLNRL
jgi:hypothetical protein